MSAVFDVAAIRRDFPILQEKVRNGKPLVYLDNAATTQKPIQVLEALDRFYRTYNANVHRAIHLMGERATEAYEGARAKIARLIHAPSDRCIVFTKNATEAINLVAYSWSHVLREGDEIVTTLMEHHSNLIPWQALARRTGARLRHFDLTPDGQLDLGALDALITEKTKLVALTHQSNVLGTINPVAEIVKAARRMGAAVLVDGAQSVPHMPVDVQSLDCDFLVFSGHKMCGPTGVGVLYGKLERLEAMEPFLYGGEMIAHVSLSEATWKESPWKFEAGTPPIAEAIGLGAAADYLLGIGMQAIHEHEQRLLRYATERMRELGVTIYGPAEPRGGLLAFNLGDVHPHDLATVVDQDGVALRAGHHCAQPLMRWLDVPATARVSFYLYNTEEEIDLFISSLRNTKEFFKHVLR